MNIRVTYRARDALLKSREALVLELNRVRKSMNIGGATGDGWHDEGFKTGIGDEQRLMTQISNNAIQLSQCQVIIPEEQAESVKIGNVVRVEYLTDHSEWTFVIDGIPSYDDVCSSNSPLGQVLVGKKKGDLIKIPNSDTTVRVVEIFPPSHYEVLLSKKKDSP